MANFDRNVAVALQGIRSFFSTEKNGQAMGIIALLTIAAGILLGISAQEWLDVLACIALVICLEMMNSAIEKICNFMTTERMPAIKTIKDISAGAVLLASIISAVAGCIIFYPYIAEIVKNITG